MHKGQKMPEWVKKKISESEKGKHVSLATRKKLRKVMLGQIGENCRNWDGDNVGYVGIHQWLRKEFGKADRCENSECVYPKRNWYGKIMKFPKRFEWALIHGKDYKRRRENFWRLCSSCHIKYDMTDERREKLSLIRKQQIYG